MNGKTDGEVENKLTNKHTKRRTVTERWTDEQQMNRRWTDRHRRTDR